MLFWGMKFFCLIIALLIFSGCKSNLYYGVVYDFENKHPISGVEIDDYLNSIKTVSDSNGHFSLAHGGRISGRLIFKKAGYSIDTLETISSKNGEEFIERFKGDTVYLFTTTSNFRDSIYKLNSVPVAAIEANNTKFTGDWTYESQETEETSATFALHIKTKGNRLSGSYCAVSRGGKKIDCVEKDDPDNISGLIRNDTAYVSFKGNLDVNARGNAKIYFKEDVLVWEFIKENYNGEFYLPIMAELNKASVK